MPLPALSQPWKTGCLCMGGRAAMFSAIQGQAEGLPIHKSTPRHRSQLQHTAHYHVNLTYGIRLKSTDHALNATFINHLHLKQ